MTSALFHSVVCRGNSITASDWNRNNKFIKKAGPIIAPTPDSFKKVLEERTRRKHFKPTFVVVVVDRMINKVICAHSCEAPE